MIVFITSVHKTFGRLMMYARTIRMHKLGFDNT